MCKVCDERKLEIEHDLEEAHQELSGRVEKLTLIVSEFSQLYIDAGRVSAGISMGLHTLPEPRPSNNPDVMYTLMKRCASMINRADDLVRKVVDESSAARDAGLHIKGMEMMKMLMDKMPPHEHHGQDKKPTLH